VRDAMMARSSSDFDLVTDARPDEIREICTAEGVARTIYAVGERFGTLGLVLAGGTHVEVSRYRDAALTATTTAERFSADAALRDFTINAMGVDLTTGELLDPAGGRDDLAARILRTPGRDPSARFAEDPLRVLRLARFAAQLGFDTDPPTLDAARAHAPALGGIAAERVRDELTKLLMSEHPDRGLGIALQTGALEAVLPEVAAMDGVVQPSFHDLDVLGHTVQTVTLAPPTHALRWAALLHDVGKVPARTVEPDGRIRFFGHPKIGARIAEQICRRLRMSNAQTAAIVHLVSEHMRLGDLHAGNRRAVDRAVRRLDLWERGSNTDKPLVSAEDAVALTVADFGATAGRERTSEVRERLESVIAASRQRGTGDRPRHAITGTELMAELGIAEGPSVGTAIEAVDAAVASGEIAADDRDGALDVARRLASPDASEGDSSGRAR